MTESTILKLQKNINSWCEVNLIGGGVMDLYLDGKRILYAGDRPDGGTAFSHPCIPNFNLAENLPNHGPARKEAWQQINENSITWEMKPIPNVYPKGLHVTRIFTIEDRSLSVETIVKNNAEEPLPINIAEHTYFYCANENKKDITINSTHFSKQALEADAQFNAWSEENTLFIPKIGNLLFSVSGYHAFAQWSQPEGDFACVEPIQMLPMEPDQFFSKAPQLEAGKSKSFEYTIQLIGN